MTPDERKAAILEILRKHGPIQNYLIRAKLPDAEWVRVFQTDRAIQSLRKEGKIRRVGVKWEIVPLPEPPSEQAAEEKR